MSNTLWQDDGPKENENSTNKNNEWYTPTRYVEAARAVMGGIDLDPASCLEANLTVRATHIYTASTNGLMHPWHGRVWLNPPYLTEGVVSSYTTWTRKLVSEYESGNTKQAVLLIPVHSERQWFQALYQFPICFCDHQIMFIRPNQPAYHLYHGLCFVYLGPNVTAFEEAFIPFGPVGQFKQTRKTIVTPELWQLDTVAS